MRTTLTASCLLSSLLAACSGDIYLRDGVTDRKSLVSRLVEKYEVEKSAAEADVKSFVEELSRGLMGDPG